MVSIPDLLVLSRIPSIGPQRLRALVQHFGDSTPALSAPARDLAGVEGFNKKLASGVAEFSRSPGLPMAREYARRQISRAHAVGASIASYWDAAYPGLLRSIYDPPPYLYIQGAIENIDSFGIGIVGTRSPSEYAAAEADRFGRAFAMLGITVVSGLARGIDTIAHTGALRQGGRTIAVIGSGLDILYPPENRLLSEKIAGHGAVISECEMGAAPEASNFPRRNRLISGMTLGTLVIETDVDGGAMITANAALDQNREVFAVPGNIGAKRSRGCNMLIRDGKAKLVESIDDIIVELRTKLPATLLPPQATAQTAPPELTFFERSLYDHLSSTPIDIDSLAELANFSTSDTLVNLLSLEFKGMARQLPGKKFIKEGSDPTDFALS